MLEMIKKLITSPISTSQQNIGRAGRFAIFQIKLWYHCTKLLRQNRIRQQAAALSYYTIFGIVPLAIVVLLIFQSFPAFSELGDKVKNFIYAQAHLSSFQTFSESKEGAAQAVTLTQHLDELIGRFFTGANQGTITIFSIISVIVAAISLLSTIEKTFNNVWNISKGRSLIQQVVNYWAVLTLGPLLIGAGLYATAYFSIIGRLQKTVSTTLTPVAISYFIAAVVFFLLYLLMPNTKVRIKPALWGAAVAALAWIIAREAFAYLVVGLKIYNTVYGMLALIPMTVVWIYIIWLIVIFGLQLTYTTQNLKSLDDAEILASQKSEQYFIANDFTVINIVGQIASAAGAGGPVEETAVCSRLNLPQEFCGKILNQLVAKGILARTIEPKAGYVPARDTANIKLSEITEAVSEITLLPNESACGGPLLTQMAKSQGKDLSNYTVKQLIKS
jgi:membrane protein